MLRLISVFHNFFEKIGLEVIEMLHGLLHKNIKIVAEVYIFIHKIKNSMRKIICKLKIKV